MYPIKPQANPNLYTVKEVSDILRVGLGKTYELTRTKGFPVIRIGKSIRIPKSRFHEWLDKQSQVG